MTNLRSFLSRLLSKALLLTVIFGLLLRGGSVTGASTFQSSLASAAIQGSPNAPVVIIEFSDFECPFCRRVWPTIQELLRTYPDQVQFVFKHSPLPIHENAPLAHEAALAAGQQGRFWEMHDLLFANQERLGPKDLVEYAKQQGLDAESFLQALQSRMFKGAVDRDVLEAKALGVTATPTFFVNGRKLVGAQSLETFKSVIDEELGRRPTSGLETPDTEDRVPDIDVATAPIRGAPSAPVTIVEFSDLQCPFCASAIGTLHGLMAAYPDKIRWVFKHFPLDFHQDSALAHEAALAAGEQRKFWEMHDWIFANQRTMRRHDLVRAAKELGLEMGQFLRDLDSGRFKDVVRADQAEGMRLSVSGTPTFFINGRRLVGARAAADFQRLIEEELRLLAGGGSEGR